MAKAKLNYYSQASQLGDIKAIRPGVASVQYQLGNRLGGEEQASA
jgi:hypothetical protein